MRQAGDELCDEIAGFIQWIELLPPDSKRLTVIPVPGSDKVVQSTDFLLLTQAVVQSTDLLLSRAWWSNGTRMRSS